MCEESVRGVEHHLWSSDSHPAYREIRTLHSCKPIPQCTAVKVEGVVEFQSEGALGWLL